MRYVAETATDGQFAFFEDALAREYALRHQSRIARLKRQANFPSQKGFDGFEWSGIVFPRGFTRDDMLSLAFIDAHEDLVLFGGSGNGNYAGLPIMLRNGAEPQADGLEPPCSPA